MKSLLSLVTTVLLLPLCGCSIIGNMDQLSTLSEYSKEKEGQHKTIKAVDTNYAFLVEAVQSGKIKEYATKEDVLKNFGEPLSKLEFDTVTGRQEQWLYRQAIAHKSKDKVYLYFDAEGKLVNSMKEEIKWH